jgi:hypothetical protein
MSYGFVIRSGSGSIVESVSSDTPPGVLLDTFTYIYSLTPMTKTYSGFVGSQLLPIIQSTRLIGSTVNITVNNAEKSITIVGKYPASENPASGNVLVAVLGV